MRAARSNSQEDPIPPLRQIASYSWKQWEQSLLSLCQLQQYLLVTEPPESTHRPNSSHPLPVFSETLAGRYCLRLISNNRPLFMWTNSLLPSFSENFPCELAKTRAHTNAPKMQKICTLSTLPDRLQKPCHHHNRFHPNGEKHESTSPPRCDCFIFSSGNRPYVSEEESCVTSGGLLTCRGRTQKWNMIPT